MKTGPFGNNMKTWCCFEYMTQVQKQNIVSFNSRFPIRTYAHAHRGITGFCTLKEGEISCRHRKMQRNRRHSGRLKVYVYPVCLQEEDCSYKSDVCPPHLVRGDEGVWRL